MRQFHTPTNQVPAARWNGWLGELRPHFDERDARRSQVRGALGEPSFTVEATAGAWRAAVDAYMRDGDPTAWIFFDYQQETAPHI